MYIEVIIIENLIVNIILVSIYLSFTNIKISKIKFFILNLLMSIGSCLIKIYCNNSVILTLLLNVIFIYLVNKTENIRGYIKNIVYYNVIYFLFIGILFCLVMIFNLDNSTFINRCITYIVIGILIKLFIDILWKMWITKIKYKENTYYMYIEKTNKFIMFLDSGNFAYFAGNIPVIILNEDKYLFKFKKENKKIDYKESYRITLKTINGSKYFFGYIYENIVIKKGDDYNKKIDKAFITFTDEKIKNDMFDGILPSDILIEK